ncbi:MAG: dihydrodipicolinate synthase family protein [Planctomycetota bacterium]|jgi:4-hydroxy-tetrahydrodipicolinate synthase
MLVTALVTPWKDQGATPDLELFTRLVSFSLEHGTEQVLIGGTTGEGGALDESERVALLDAALSCADPDRVMFSIGGGRPDNVLARGRAALARGVHDLLLADAPYSGASSTALRERWHAPVARGLPDARLWPYAVPGRTGTELLPDDLARLAEDCPNVVGVKDATGRLARMTRVRELCGDEFTILCGDDLLLRDALMDPNVRANGGCTVSSNLAPAAVRALVDAGLEGDAIRARELHDALTPLFSMVGVTADEEVIVRDESLRVPQRSRNPVPVKAALALLGVMEPDCRAPLGPLGVAGMTVVRDNLRLAHRRDKHALEPLARAFDCALEQVLPPPAAPELAAGAS